MFELTMESPWGLLHECAYIPMTLGVAQGAQEAQPLGPLGPPGPQGPGGPRPLGPWASWATSWRV
jgi:hypothetical protein